MWKISKYGRKSPVYVDSVPLPPVALAIMKAGDLILSCDPFVHVAKDTHRRYVTTRHFDFHFEQYYFTA